MNYEQIVEEAKKQKHLSRMARIAKDLEPYNKKVEMTPARINRLVMLAHELKEK